MIWQNLHTHTLFGDGKNSAEEMVLGAIASGCTSLGFSEHSHLPSACDDVGWTMAEGNTPIYRQEIRRLQSQYGSQLEIFLGLEQDLDSTPAQDSWDYLIGSVHGIWANGVYRSVDYMAGYTADTIREYFSGDPYAYTRTYFERAAVVSEITRCQIVGHFDVVAKFNEGNRFFDEEDPRYLSAAMEALESVMQHDVIFEINTGAMSRGYRTVPYPSPVLLKAIQALHGRICIASDSHSANTIAHAFQPARELAKHCGFQESWILTKKGFIAQEL